LSIIKCFFCLEIQVISKAKTLLQLFQLYQVCF
jgi:hypothetical protein